MVYKRAPKVFTTLMSATGLLSPILSIWLFPFGIFGITYD